MFAKLLKSKRLQTKGPGTGIQRQLLWTVSGTALLAIAQWAVLSSIAKTLGSSELGHYALALALANPTFVLAKMSLAAVYVTDIDSERTFHEYLTIRIIAASVGFCFVTALALTLYEAGNLLLITALVAGAQATDAVRDILLAHLQKNGHVDLLGRSHVVRFGLRAVVVPFSVVMTHNLAIGLVADLAICLGTLVLHDGRQVTNELERSWFKPSPVGKSELWGILAGAIPLSLALVIVSLQTQIPRYIIEGELGAEQLGIWTAVFGTAGLATPAFGALATVALPRLSRSWAAGNARKFLTLLGGVSLGALTIGGTGLLLLWNFGEPILGLLFTEDIAQSSELLIPLSIATTFIMLANSMGVAITAMRKFKAPLIPHVVTTTGLLLALLRWVPEGGLRSAALMFSCHSGAVFVAFCAQVLFFLRPRHPPEKSKPPLTE